MTVCQVKNRKLFKVLFMRRNYFFVYVVVTIPGKLYFTIIVVSDFLGPIAHYTVMSRLKVINH